MENCNKCNEVKIVGCGCQKPTNCGCGTKVDLKCTEYSGELLETLHITEGMTGEEIVVAIDDYLRDLIIDIQPEPVIIENAGTGTELYKGLSQVRRHEIKSLLSGSGIQITETEDSVTLSLDPQWIPRFTSPDYTLRIQGNEIMSNVSIFDENFSDVQEVNLAFEPVQILGVYVEGLKLKDSDYILTLPTNIEFLTNTTGKDINIQYRHLITTNI